MQNFEPDQLVLVKNDNTHTWSLRRYSMPVFGKMHETQDVHLWDDDAIIPYQGNENLLGESFETPEQQIKRLEREKEEIHRHSENIQVFLNGLHGQKNENNSLGVWGFIVPLLCSFRR